MSDATETWLPIVGFEGKYEVSDLGRVRSLPVGRCHGKVLRSIPRHYGHLVVTLCGGKGAPGMNKYGFKQRFIHELVLEAFVEPRPPGLVCRHLNGDPADNHPENLRWGTMLENGQDMVRHGTSWQSRKTECPSGHPYTPENTRMWQGRRYCRICQNTRAAAWRLAHQAP